MIIITQALQTYYLLLDINIVLAYSFLAFAALILIIAVLYPTMKFMLLPKATVLPTKEDYETNPGKRKVMLDFLKQNKTLRRQLVTEGRSIAFDDNTTDEEIEVSIKILNNEAEKVIRSNASRVFITTTISQNGSLDAIFVLVHLTKMIWHVASIYHQRPGVKNLLKIYFNVIGTIFLTRSLEDLELLDEQLEPVMTLLFGSFLSSVIPGVQTAVNLVLNSAIQGSANAYLTLRVGLIAQEFIVNEQKKDKRTIRKSAAVRALPMLGTIVNDNRKIIQSNVIRLAKKVSKDRYTKGRDWTNGLFKKGEEKTGENEYINPE